MTMCNFEPVHYFLYKKKVEKAKLNGANSANNLILFW